MYISKNLELLNILMSCNWRLADGPSSGATALSSRNGILKYFTLRVNYLLLTRVSDNSTTLKKGVRSSPQFKNKAVKLLLPVIVRHPLTQGGFSRSILTSRQHFIWEFGFTAPPSHRTRYPMGYTPLNSFPSRGCYRFPIFSRDSKYLNYPTPPPLAYPLARGSCKQQKDKKLAVKTKI